MKKHIFCLLFIVSASFMWAQTFSPKVTPASGGYNTFGGGSSFSWTIGETYNTTITAGSIIFSQGEQQPETNSGIIPVADFSANNTNICHGNSVTFTDLSTNTPTSWLWTFTGGTPASSTVQNPTITYNTAGTYNVTLTVSNAGGSNSKTVTGYITVASATPLTPSVISGNTIVCANTVGITYSVTSVAGVTYNWVAPTGATVVSGQGTNSVTVNFGNIWASGNLSVTATNACGTSLARILALKSILASPTTITGSIYQCANTTTSFTCTAVTGATSYTWSITGDATVSGTGTTGTVVFGPSFTTGVLSVTANDLCGSSSPKTITLKNSVTAPTTLTGPSTGLCPSGTATATYSTTAVAGAASYTWTLPSGATGSSTTNTISVTFGPTFTSGNISVAAVSVCGIVSAAKVLALKSILTTAPTTITGSIYQCANTTVNFTCTAVTGATSYGWSITGDATVSGTSTTGTVVFGPAFTTGVLSVTANNGCGSSPAKTLILKNSVTAPTTLTGPTTGLCPSGIATATYATTVVAGAVSYNWTLPTGATGSSTTNSISVTFGPTFTSGNIGVAAVSVCGVVSTMKTLALKSILSAPLTITGNVSSLCGTTGNVYNCASVVGATSYTWTVPSGGTITSGQGTTSVMVDFSTLSAGNIAVTADNDCGSSMAKILALKGAPATPVAITGTTSICANQTGVIYSTAAIATATSYLWTVPSGAIITSGQGTTGITVNFGTSAGNITVKAINSCGTGIAKSLATTINCIGLINNSIPRTPIEMNDKVGEENSFSLHPNPTSSEFAINIISDIDKEIIVEVYDMLGNKVILQKHTVVSGTSTLTINIEQFENGMYFVRLADGDNNVIYMQRVVKE